MSHLIKSTALSLLLIESFACLTYAFSPLQEEQINRLDELAAKKKRQFDKLVAKKEKEIEKKWNRLLLSSKTEWVRYSDDGNALSIVNFKDGSITVSTVIPEDTKTPAKVARKYIKQEVENLFAEKDYKNSSILENQLKDDEGRLITPNNVKVYAELITEKAKEEAPITGQDGVTRNKYSVNLTMVPNHKLVRLEKYLDLILKYSSENGIHPSLIMAIIDIESSFNPKAVSPKYALGLMQIVPQSGGSIAYEYLYSKQWIPDREYLFNPDNNIKLGVAYLKMLNDMEFGNINDPLKRKYLTIASYNWGPQNVKRKLFANGLNMGELSSDSLYELLMKSSPSETRNYLAQVIEKEKYYLKFIG